MTSGRKFTQEQFIEIAKETHGDKYDYSKVKYTKIHEHVIIICSEHGEFLQTPAHHKRGHGCISCGDKTKGPVLTFEKFVEKARKTHGDKYQYRREWFNGTWYMNSGGDSSVSVECPKHGKFTLASPSVHYRKMGSCPACRKDAKRPALLKKFVAKSTAIHGNFYDYTRVHYVNPHTRITIICPDHGPFTQYPLAHYTQGSGCPLCVSGGHVSAASRIWLESLYIPDLEFEKTLYLKSRRVRVDGYSQSCNTAFEFLGTWWHGHPDFHDAMDIHPRIKKEYGELYHNTLQRLDEIKQAGYNLGIMWEHDWRKKSGIHNIPAARNHR